jgi:papain fold toxin 1 (glutamine deamidase) of polymorphic toxin system
MSLLPSPIPHPLEFSPFDVPGWAYEALEWVVGFDWPAGNEVATWDVADRWYVLAKELASPQEATFDAATTVLAGYGGAGITADGFRTAFQQLAGDENAPLNALLQVADGLGELVEGCGRDLEAAKLEAWIEIGIFLTELVGMAITVALTFGAASPAAGGLIMATRTAIQQIFKRLVEQLGKQALKSTAKHAIKDITTKEGLAKLGKKALHEGFEEAREEFATNAGIQLYQDSTGRAHGFSFTDLGLSSAGGFAGGAAATGSGVGAHGHGGVVRGAGGEVLAEFGAAAAFGDIAGLGDVAKAGTSGASGSTMHALASTFHPPSIKIDSSLGTQGGPFPLDATDSVGGPPVAGVAGQAALFGDPANLSRDGSLSAGDSRSLAFVAGDAPGSASVSSDVTSPAGAAASASDPAAAASTTASATSDPPSAVSSTASATSNPASSGSDPAAAASNTGSSAPASNPSATSFPVPNSGVSDNASVSDTSGSLSGSGVSHSFAASETSGPVSVSGPGLLPGTSDGGSSLSDISPLSAGPAAVGSDPALAGASIGSSPADNAATPGASTARPPLSDLDRIAAALGPAAPRVSPHRPVPPRHASFSSFTSTNSDRGLSSLLPTDPNPNPNPNRNPAPKLDRNPNPDPGPGPGPGPDPRRFPPSHTSPVRNETGYFGYANHARRTHELNRRDEYIHYLTGLAEENRAKILSLGREADLAFREGLTLLGEDHRRRATEFSAIVEEIETQIDGVRTGHLAPAKIEVGPYDWARINTDVGDLAPGGVHTDDRSAVTGTAGRPPIDRTRRYNTVGGLRAPLSVHQTDLEEAVPRDNDGRPQRLPDPRSGRWFRLANDGGPEADPTRGLNCVDGVLALFDTYIHGRPRVSAPRTFDTYAHGNPDRPLGGETNGVRRIQTATGTFFQNLCPYVGGVDPAAAKPAVDVALRNLTNHLLNTGHGAYAFIITDVEAGGSHAWAATNHHGTVLFLDPQVSKISENRPLYTHRGIHTNANITSMDALVVDGNGHPAPLPHHGPGQRAATPTGSTSAADDEASDGGELDDQEQPFDDPAPDPDFEAAEAAAERQAYESLLDSERREIDGAYDDVKEFADGVLEELHNLVAALPATADGHRPKLVGEKNRRKTPHSMARAFLESASVEEPSLPDFLASMKDRVRFSVEVSEVGYGNTVAGVLRSMRDRGYEVTKILSFWGTGRGRHNGLNVSLVASEGRLVEVQFPTPLSGSAGKATHNLYRRVRNGRFTPQERVEALLRIMSINHRRGLPNHQPADLEALAAVGQVSHLDTGLASWVQANSTLWRRYLATLEAAGVSLEDKLSSFKLGFHDVFDQMDRDVATDDD